MALQNKQQKKPPKTQQNPLKAILPAMFLIVAVVFAGIYYTTNKDALTYNPFSIEELQTIDEAAQNIDEVEQEDADLEDADIEDGSLEILIPERVVVSVSDQRGRLTGRTALDDDIKNGIPLSEYAVEPQAILQAGEEVDEDAVHWMYLSSQVPVDYRMTLRQLGPADVIVIYGKNNDGTIVTETIDITRTEQLGNTFTLSFNPTDDTEIISLQ